MNGQHAFALVDCAVHPDRMAALLHHASTTESTHRSLFTGQPEADHASAGPWLLQLPVGAIQTPLHRWLDNLAHSPAGVSTLTADVGFEALFFHLQALLDLTLPDGSIALMRFYDPRALLGYCEVLTLPQQQILLGPVRQWQIVTQGGSWMLDRAQIAHQEALDVAPQC